MVKNVLKGLSLFLAALLLQRVAFAAEVVELPPEELAQESVYPVFDKPVSVKNRNIVTEGHYEIGGYYGNALSEPVFNVSKFGLYGYYNSSEEHAFGLFFEKNASGLNKYAEQLKSVPSNNGGPPVQLDLSRAPAPDSTIMFDYNFKAFYGKMSLSKSAVFNLTTFASLSGGLVKYTHKSYPGVSFGIGQKYHLGHHWSLRWDLRMFANNAPSPFNSKINVNYTGSVSPSDFKERLSYTTVANVGIVYLF